MQRKILHAKRLWSLIVINVNFIITEKFRFSTEFIEMRCQALDSFINRIALHHDLQQSEDLRTFLQADEEVMLRGPMLWVSHFHPSLPQEFIMNNDIHVIILKSIL